MTLSNEALRSILPIAGWSDRRVAEVVFAGGADPVLPTPLNLLPTRWNGGHRQVRHRPAGSAI